jgi:hypothetical protein
MAKKVGQDKPGTGRNRRNERINGAEAGRSSAPSYRGELDAKIEGLLTAGALSRDDLDSLIAALEQRDGADLRRQLRDFIRSMGGGTPGYDEDDAVQEAAKQLKAAIAKGITAKSAMGYWRDLAANA